jgi:hypothetical protein
MPPPLPASNDSSKPIKAATEATPKRSKKYKDLDDPNKKPPRPYTEYNIFFQLERERILMDLERENQQKELGYIPPEEHLLNTPSDPNDILPRPPRFAHLKLLPKWYDSKHRLAENKKNKEKRKHRKTHGLVGFLDLTRRIAKEWGEAEEEVKAYCRRVSKRQLAYYKEELKVWKKLQDRLLPAELQDAMEVNESGDIIASMTSLPTASLVEKMPELPSKEVVRTMPPPHQVIHRSMPPPPPAPHSYGHHHVRNMHWQSHPSSQHHHAHPMNINRNYPTMPALSPSTDYHDDYRYYTLPGSNMHPLDELMHRRKLYGSRSAMMQPTRVRKRKTEGAAALENKEIKEEEVISPSEGNVKETNSFLSPDDTLGANDANTAITPSPCSRSSGPQDHLPMKKRRKKMGDDLGGSDVSPGSFGSGISPNEAKLSPFNFSPSEGMIMTPNGEAAFMGQMMGISPSLGQWESESFPYIDCFSPQEGGTVAGDAYRRPSVASMYPPSPYIPPVSQWQHENVMPYGSMPLDTNMMTNPEEDFSDSDALDLDDEELQLMRRLQATRAKRWRQKHQLMQQHAGSQEWAMAQSPGGPMLYNYSFASPVEKSGCAEEVKK